MIVGGRRAGPQGPYRAWIACRTRSIGSVLAPEDFGRSLPKGSIGARYRLRPHGVSLVLHHAAAFAQAGVPVGMIFVRNENGSHNPAEHMEIDDFLDGTALMTAWLQKELT